MGLPAEFPTHTTSLPSNNTWSFSLSLGCVWHPQIYFFCHIKYETVWEGKSPLILGGCGCCSCSWALETFRVCWKKQQQYGCWVLCSCLSNRFLSLPRLVYTLVEERKSEACENLFVMSIRVSHLCCNSSISFTLLFFMGKAYGVKIGGGGALFLFPFYSLWIPSPHKATFGISKRPAPGKVMLGIERNDNLHGTFRAS